QVCIPLLPSGDFLLTEGGRVLDTRTGQRLVTPDGRKYHPTLTRFAPDGRFVVTNEGLIDPRTERAFPLPDWQSSPGPEYVHQPGFGFLTADLRNSGYVGIRLLPTAALIELPPDLLELWLQVVLRGELGPDGAFVKWNEPTWEKKRQELAS